MSAVENGANYIYVTGHAQAGFSNGGRLFLSKLDQQGDTLWTRDNSGEMVNNAWSIGRAITKLNGYIYVAGHTADEGAWAYLAKYDQAGNFVWSRKTSPGSYVGLTVHDGYLFAVGQDAVSGSANYLVDKWDEEGNRVWTRTHDHENANEALHGVVAWNGRLVAAGYSRDAATENRDAAVLEIDPGKGDLLARTIYGGALDDLANGVATDGTDIYVVGETESFALPDNANEDSDGFIARYTPAPVIPASLILTGLLLDVTDATGAADQANYWNTVAGDYVWNFWLTLNTGVAGPLINDPDDANAGPLSIDLRELGRYSFACFARWSGTFEHVALNVFFNSENRLPAISAKTAARLIGEFSANSAETTHSLAPAIDAALVPAAGRISFTQGDRRVTLVDFRWYSGDFVAADFPVNDRVSNFDASADGESDARGIFILEVTLAGPSLTIAQTSPETYRISWPSPSTGYRLHERSALDAASWMLVDAPPADDGAIKSLNLTAQTGNRFYCLIKIEP